MDSNLLTAWTISYISSGNIDKLGAGVNAVVGVLTINFNWSVCLQILPESFKPTTLAKIYEANFSASVK